MPKKKKRPRATIDPTRLYSYEVQFTHPQRMNVLTSTNTVDCSELFDLLLLYNIIDNK